MNYYPFHIGDFNNATRHLDRIERSIYRDLIDLYYDKESPLPAEVSQIARLICATDCLTSVEQVLNEFFYLTDLGWVNDRCEQTLTEYKELSEKRSKAGKASAKARRCLKSKGKAASTSVEQVLNKCGTSVVQTNNQKPITKTNNQSIYRQRLKSLCVPDDLIDEWLAIRKKNKGVDSERAFNAFMAEVEKSGLSVQRVIEICCTSGKGWVSFKAEWIANRKQHGKEDFLTMAERVARKFDNNDFQQSTRGLLE